MPAQTVFYHRDEKHIIDTEIHVKQLTPECLELTQDFHFDDIVVPKGFIYNGASSPNTPLARWIAPKFYKNIKASCVHDWLCTLATNKEERRKADKIYYLLKKYVERDSSFAVTGSFLGVRIGALLGIGSSF